MYLFEFPVSLLIDLYSGLRTKNCKSGFGIYIVSNEKTTGFSSEIDNTETACESYFTEYVQAEQSDLGLYTWVKFQNFQNPEIRNLQDAYKNR